MEDAKNKIENFRMKSLKKLDYLSIYYKCQKRNVDFI